jgi:hypothetical protein
VATTFRGIPPIDNLMNNEDQWVPGKAKTVMKLAILKLNGKERDFIEFYIYLNRNKTGYIFFEQIIQNSKFSVNILISSWYQSWDFVDCRWLPRADPRICYCDPEISGPLFARESCSRIFPPFVASPSRPQFSCLWIFMTLPVAICFFNVCPPIGVRGFNLLSFIVPCFSNILDSWILGLNSDLRGNFLLIRMSHKFF